MASAQASVANLRHIEDLLIEVGADTSILHNTQLKSSKPKLGNTSGGTSSYRNNKAQDCLAVGPRGGGNNTTANPIYPGESSNNTHSPNASAISRRSNSSMKGISFAGKSTNDSMYLGKGFEGPSRESPGPIYQPVSTLDTTHGVSFTKAQRGASHNKSVSQGPDLALPGSIGKQSLSTNANPANVVFSKAERWQSNDNDSANVPLSYQPTTQTTNDGKSFSFSNAKTVAANKLFISRGHIADCQGLDSPGPMYYLEDAYKNNTSLNNSNGKPPVFVAMKSKYTNGPSFSFASKKRMEEDKNGEDSSYRRAKSVDPSSTPGPGQYQPKHDVTEATAPSVSFTRQRIHSASRAAQVHQSVPTVDEMRQMEPYECPSLQLQKSNPSVSWGKSHDGFNRMNEKVYLGKGMEFGRGRDSPGPAFEGANGDAPYDPSWRNGKYVGKGASLSFKERTVTKRLHTGPEKARFISRELATENLGAYSPGPKYNPGPHPGWDRAPALGFGGHPDGPTATINNSQANEASRPQASNIGPAAYNPSIEATSKYKRTAVVGIAPPSNGHAAAIDEGGNPVRPTMYNPSYKQIDMAHHVHSFGKAKRQLEGGANALPGPGQYQPIYTQVETRVQDVSIGIM